ncbi:asparaginase [Oxalobacter vibrioformis]|uniref:Asparaginase n=1 Tax=Oxalobacter vibrioformis TaxID=933080 RepID=A0A9E9LZ68_9BURK|nr:asparaginase domain-containing protein [Oxalobacter vibrioformis]NLC23939.1 asparaginase [Oxalobacter sp.]WAW11186.1 asparaginase [Oxalobacter vibrioformis]
MAVRIIATGGTFDKQYNPIDGTLGFEKSQVPQMLEQGRVHAPFVFEALPLLDSLDMTDTDRERVLHACQQAPEDRILIIHGTDTMQETALVLALASLEKTIVLTGAMIPYAVSGSDAFFNLGYAFGVVRLLEPDVYIAMNGRLFRWDDVRKDRARGVFETDS